MPGHEIIGRIAAAGSAVTRFKTGDAMDVGCTVDSCGTCSSCREGDKNYYVGPVVWTATYNGYTKPQNEDFNAFGGYSTNIMVKESFVLRIPDALDIKTVAPILCAG